MSRDLIYKPPVPLVVPDEAPNSKKAGAAIPVRSTDKLGLTTRGRDIGGTPETKPTTTPGAVEEPTPGQAPQTPPAPVTPKRGPAYKSAYFTKDVAATQNVNLRARPAKALRGAEGASDLRKVVLPPPSGVETPEPAQLRAALDLMGVQDGFSVDVGSLLSRQGSWAKAKGVTVEMIQARLAQLEQMVRDRKAALWRMAHVPPDRLSRSVTITQAALAGGDAMQQVDDLAHDGTELAQHTAKQAAGLHRWIAKALGIK